MLMHIQQSAKKGKQVIFTPSGIESDENLTRFTV